MVGFLLFAVTIGVVPIYFFSIVFIYEIIYRRDLIKRNLRQNENFFKSILVFCLLCILNAAIHGFHDVPNFVLLPFTIILGLGMKKDDFKIFVYLLLVESLFGIYEQYIGVSSLLNIQNTNEFENEEMLYYRKATGLSNSSASFALKLMVGMFLVEFLKNEWAQWKRIIIVLFLFLGIISSFNRTVLGISFIYILVSILINYKDKIRKSYLTNICLLLFLVSLVYLIIAYYDSIFFQFARGNATVDISGRSEIWPKFLNYIEDNILMGNGSCRLLVPYRSGLIHAHNSFLQLIADNGIVLSIYFLFLIFSKINKLNRLYVISFFLIGLAQFVIFWGMSLTDVFFYAFLCNYSLYQVESKSGQHLKSVRSHVLPRDNRHILSNNY